MGLLTTTNLKNIINNGSVTLIRENKNGSAVIVCPACSGLGKKQHPGYSGNWTVSCMSCNGGGAIEVKVVKQK